ncbi:MAG: D-2-hydroxyacid dehydrogenase [Zoogloeaceae bacterium]|nr:D-2-hydroxyacid dehydrogenase [Zoogloeaceae bacterium]
MSIRIVNLEGESVAVGFRTPSMPHEWIEYPLTPAGRVVERLQGAQVAIINKVKLTAADLAQLPDLKMVAVAATGTDNIDLAACRERGVVVSNVRGYAVNTVPEHAILLMMALRRSLLAYHDDVQKGLWAKSGNFCLFGHPVGDLHGATLGIFGSGSLGQGVALLAAAFGMNILYGERRGAEAVREGYTAFETVLREADVISMHCPLNDSTRGMIGAAELRMMKPTAVLVNTSRGGLVDEQALADALRAGVIAGAGIDVLSKEPPTEGNPLLATDIPNLIVTPHMAWASETAMKALTDQVIDNIEAFVAGSPRNRVA